MEVLVFKTSVETMHHVNVLRSRLDSVAGRGRWNFALDDCDRILRIVSVKISAQQTIQLLHEHGYDCVELED